MTAGGGASGPLAGVSVVTLAPNLPGPAAAARLVTLGASVTKVEPPAGDFLAMGCPPYYAELVAGQEVVTLDLKDDAARERLWELLADADVLLTSSRPRALQRLGLDWESLHARLPRLSQVAIVGYPGDRADVPGHDLTYQAGYGTLAPPTMPLVLVADLAGAERAAGEAAAAVLAAHRTGTGVLREVALSECARSFAAPARHGLTTPDGVLGGAAPMYGLYRSTDGWVALAALEPHFWTGLQEALTTGENPPAGSRSAEQIDAAALQEIFATRTCAEWDDWATSRDLPIAAVLALTPSPTTGQDAS